jgi:hypothetical protein
MQDPAELAHEDGVRYSVRGGNVEYAFEHRVVQGALEDAHHVLFVDPTDILPTRPDGTAQETFRDGFKEAQGASPTA